MGQTMHVSFNGGAANVAMPLRATYGDVSKQMPLGLYYDGLLQLAINEGNFAEEHKVRRGQVVSIRRQALHGS
jgi:S-adenosylmethionine hydrolase